MLAAWWQFLYALDPSHSVHQYGHRAWTREQGHLPGGVFSVTQTRDGPLWVGTEFGLFRFDGITFTAWQPPGGEQLSSPVITALEPDQEAGLWIGTRDSVLHWNGNVLQRYLISKGDRRPISAIRMDHGGNVWIGAVGFNSGGLFRLEGSKLRHYTRADGFEGGGVYSLFDDHTGNLWIGCSNGLYRWEGQGFRRYSAKDGPSQIVSPITETHDGSIIASSEAFDLVKLVGNTLQEYRVGVSSGRLRTRAILADRNGALWIGTNGQGLMHLHEDKVERLMSRDGLSGDTVISLFEDHEGNIWVGTERGLDQFRDLPVTTLSTSEGLSESSAASVVASKSGGVWVGTSKGLNKIEGNRITIYDRRSGLPSDGVGSLLEDSGGTLWVGSAPTGNRTAGLVFRSNGVFHPLDLPGSQKIRSIVAMAEDLEGVIWVSDIERGLISIEGQHVRDIVPWSVFGNCRAFALAADTHRGGILAGFAEGSIAHYRQGGRVRWYTAADGLGAGAINDLYIDRQGAAWIATRGGLSQIRNDRVATLTTANNLGCNQIHAVIGDRSGDIWINTPCGLQRLSRSDLSAWESNPSVKMHPRIYDGKDGMYSRATASGFFRRAAQSSDGRLWFPLFEGVAIVDPRNMHENALPPPVAIETIRAGNTTYSPKSGLTLGPLISDLRINYAAFSFVDTERVSFRHKLDGYDKEWHDVGGSRQALYSRLPAGRYRFRVTASNNDGIWNEAGAFLDFVVQPAIQETMWFQLLCIAVFALTLVAVYRLRLNQVKAKLAMRIEERVRERTRIGNELHDTLLQSVSGLSLHLDALSKVVREPQSVRERLRELRRQAELSLHQARESLWDLRSESDKELDQAVLQIGAQLTQGSPIQFRTTVKGSRRTIPSSMQVHLLRIAQEAIRNAVCHSQATEIQADVSYEDPCTVGIRVVDNGCGFHLDAASAMSGHWGLVTMRDRAKQLGAKFEIFTEPGRGTQVEVIARISNGHK